MKYMGSKARFRKELLPIILKDRTLCQYYVEPFAGGMNMICGVKGNRIANDSNHNLIQMWKQLINNDWIPSEYDKKDYQIIQTYKEEYEPHVLGWVGIACSYCGKYFGGYAGNYLDKGKNYKINKERTVERSYQKEALSWVLKYRDRMKGISFENKCYTELYIPPKSIIYCDPPYQYTTKYRGDFNHDIFWQWCRDMTMKGHTVFVSEYNAPIDFKCVWEKETNSELSANGKIKKSKVSTERLFLYCA